MILGRVVLNLNSKMKFTLISNFHFIYTITRGFTEKYLSFSELKVVPESYSCSLASPSFEPI